MTTLTVPAVRSAIDIAADLRKINHELSNVFIERRNAIRLLVIGLLARQHSFILGPPGTAKSALVDTLRKRIVGAGYFRVLLDKQLPKDDIFGPIDIMAAKNGLGWVRDWQGYAPDAEFVFLDEVGKSGDAALNPMLSLLEERIHKPGRTWEDAKLITAVGASNEEIDTTGSSLGAIWDRFMIRFKVDYIQEPSNFQQLLRSAIEVSGGKPTASGTHTTIDLAEIEYVGKHVIPFIDVSQAVLDDMSKLRTELRDNGIVPGDRRFRLSMRTLQAVAFLAGRDKVIADDVEVLQYVLWDDWAQADKAAEIISEYASPITKAVLIFQRDLDKLQKDIQSHQGESRKEKSKHGGTASHELSQITERLDQAVAEAETNGQDVTAFEGVQAQAKEVQFLILTEYLSMPVDRARALVA